MTNNIIHPKNLSFITTFKCTAACENCCYQCSPEKKVKLSFKEMKECMDQAISYFPSIHAIIFTGGKCVTIGKELIRSIRYASQKGLKTRIVTNGFWAQSGEKALSYLKILQEAGLKELNLSSGDEHQKWVPYDRIVWACLAAVDLSMSVAVNIESTGNSTFTSKVMLEDDRISTLIQEKKIHVQDSLWINFKERGKKTGWIQEPLNNGPCTHLFTTLTISPDYTVYACCGLTAKNSKYLEIGSLKNYSIKELYEEQFDDLLKLWLFTHGPKTIHTFLCKEKGIEDTSDNYRHMCDLCKKILSETGNMEIIKRNLRQIAPSVLMKYNFINHIQN